jgi:RHS repeat-associated protein
MRARYYDPATGRFLSSDQRDLTALPPGAQSGQAGLDLEGSPQELNRYTYAVNNPLAFLDPSGNGCTGPGFRIQYIYEAKANWTDPASVWQGGSNRVAITNRNGELLNGYTLISLTNPEGSYSTTFGGVIDSSGQPV